MPAYLSPSWFTEADALLRSSETMSTQSQGVQLVLEQRVGDSNSNSPTVWHVRFADGVVSMAEGPADSADVVFVSDTATAEGIRDGSLSAQAAFIAGDLRVEGSINALLKHAEMFAALEDVLSPLR
jgi:putative sterol carrier protein